MASITILHLKKKSCCSSRYVQKPKIMWKNKERDGYLNRCRQHSISIFYRRWNELWWKHSETIANTRLSVSREGQNEQHLHQGPSSAQAFHRGGPPSAGTLRHRLHSQHCYCYCSSSRESERERERKTTLSLLRVKYYHATQVKGG